MASYRKSEGKLNKLFRVGARGSALSVAQTKGALAFLASEFPGTTYRLVKMKTPGDRDLATPIEKSAPDFFTRDLDEAVRCGKIDCAVHSAKDLPPRLADDLDWFWLPNRADARDAWVGTPAAFASAKAKPVIGVSSARREAYARKMYPRATLRTMRGAVDARLAQVRAGDYDLALLAMAGLERLGRAAVKGLEVRPIPLTELEPPEAQGWLAVTFRAGDARFQRMRARFVKAVRFVSAGVGNAELMTVRGLKDLASADVVLYDDLMGEDLPRGTATWIHVGKRCGAHSMVQADITRLICDEARKGRRVVRLKGGDAGLFGRLAEETDALAALGIPFVVRPGVSALTAATTGTGLLLTRRGEARGFTVYTPRSTGTETPHVAFMAAKAAQEEARRFCAEGWAKTTPCALVYDAAGPREEVVCGTLGAFARRAPGAADETRPGLFLVGSCAARAWPKLGEWQGRRVLLTCSEAVMERAATAVEDRGGRPIRWPLIRLVPRPWAWPLDNYDVVVATSPSAARMIAPELLKVGDGRPAICTCGAGTDAAFAAFGLKSRFSPKKEFSARGLIDEVIPQADWSGRMVLRLRSAKAGSAVADAFRAVGALVDDAVLYDNEPIVHAAALPAFDDVFFASASAVEVFCAQYGVRALRGKVIHVMGEPTRAACRAAGLRRAACRISPMNSGKRGFSDIA